MLLLIPTIYHYLNQQDLDLAKKNYRDEENQDKVWQNICLVGDLEHEFYDFPYIGNIIIPTDFHSIIFQRGWWLNHQPAICLTND